MNTNKQIKIYGLYSTENENVKYVGKTIQIPNKRLYDHIRESKKLLTKKDKWIVETINNGFEVKCKILEFVTENNWKEKEQYWISALPNLTNTSKGGAGGRGLTYKESYDNFKKYVQKNLFFIENSNQWIEYSKLHKNLPRHPNLTYKDRGWVSWDDFLLNSKHNSNYRNKFSNFFNYLEAKEYVNNLNIKTSKDWKRHLKNNNITNGMPSSPDYYYKNDGWKSWGEFLGTNTLHNKDKVFLPYKKAKKLISELYLKTYSKWESYIKNNGLIKNIPRHPQRFYKKSGEWVSWDDFLGTL